MIRQLLLEESNSILNTLEASEYRIEEAVDILYDCIRQSGLIFTCGAGASALVAKEIAGQALEIGVPCYPLTNDLSEAQPISFCKGGYENERGLASYYANLLRKGDSLIAISASGETGFVCELAQMTFGKLVMVICITENEDSRLAKFSHVVILTKGKPERPSATKTQTCALVVGHSIMMALANRFGVTDADMVKFMQVEVIPSKPMGAK